MYLIPHYRGFFLVAAITEAAEDEGAFLVGLGFPALTLPTTTTPPLTPVRDGPKVPGLLGLPVLTLFAPASGPLFVPGVGTDAPLGPLPEAASASFRAFLYAPGDS